MSANRPAYERAPYAIRVYFKDASKPPREILFRRPGSNSDRAWAQTVEVYHACMRHWGAYKRDESVPPVMHIPAQEGTVDLDLATVHSIAREVPWVTTQNSRERGG